jgi:pyruvate dehydrogenase E1 component alpha subunit
MQVDGNDILAVRVATEEAVAKARSGGGPTLIEAVTYRLGVHTTADDPKKYRSDEEVARWEKLDPIPRFRKYLEGRGTLDEDLIQAIEREETQKVAEAVDRYEAGRAVDPLDCFTYMYKNLPAELVAQRKEFEEALAHEGHAVRH